MSGKSGGAVERGSTVMVRTAFGNEVRKRAATGVVMGRDFLVVRVCSEEEWDVAKAEGREPNTTPWPAEDVWLRDVPPAQTINSPLADDERPSHP